MSKSNENGKIGEKIAAEFYMANGYHIAERNYRAGHNEIDIIAENENSIAFAEVKTRTNTASALMYGSPKKAVGEKKKEHLLEAAKVYLRTTGIKKQPRMDVVEIFLDEKGGFLKMNYIRSAFGERENRY